MIINMISRFLFSLFHHIPCHLTIWILSVGHSICVDKMQESSGLSSSVEAEPDYHSQWSPFRCRRRVRQVEHAGAESEVRNDGRSAGKDRVFENT